MKLFIAFLLVFLFSGCQWLKDNPFSFTNTGDCISGSVEGQGSAALCSEKEDEKEPEPEKQK